MFYREAHTDKSNNFIEKWPAFNALQLHKLTNFPTNPENSPSTLKVFVQKATRHANIMSIIFFELST